LTVDELSDNHLGSNPSQRRRKPANPAYTVPELTHQIKDSNPRFLITHPESLDIAIKTARNSGIPVSNVVIGDSVDGYVGVNNLISDGKAAPAVEEVSFGPGEAGRRLALLCYSSGTSGLPKGVLMSHRNFIANLCQGYEFAKDGPYFGTDRVAVGVLLFYHSSTSLLELVNASVWDAYIGTGFDLRYDTRYCSNFRS